MAILLAVTDRDVRPLKQKVEALLEGQTEVWIYPEIPDPQQVEMAVLWKHPEDLLSKLPNLQLVSSLGAGVDHIFNDPGLPNGIAVTRIVDEHLTSSMRNYILMLVLSIQRSFRFIIRNQEQREWVKPDPVERSLKIGVLGLGHLGSDVARYLTSLNFEVWGYSRTPKNMEDINCVCGGAMRPEEFVRKVNLLICLLPATEATENILNYDLFKNMPKGSFLINVARGSHLVEPDLVQAISEGYIREAYLDVFREEPLPPNHPFWTTNEVIITPHIASITDQNKAAAIIADNYRRLCSGAELQYEASPTFGY